MSKEEIMVDRKIITLEWINAIPKAFEYFYDKIAPVIKAAAVDKIIYPEQVNTFRAFKECTPDKVKVVMVGQDPFHDGSAVGLAFDNKHGSKRISPSLINILKELDSDMKGEQKTLLEDSYLGHWVKQGVLMINTALTVEAGKPNSHSEIWAPFTEQVIEYLNTKDDIIWILWGNYAKGYKKKITNSTHHFIEGSHPSPLSANKGGFFGGKYFSKANEILKSLNKTKITW